MINKLSPTALLIPVVDLPINASTEHLELRLLPYWNGVKHFRTNLLFKYHTPQDYYWHILRHNQNPTIVDGKVVGFILAPICTYLASLIVYNIKSGLTLAQLIMIITTSLKVPTT